MEFSYRHIGLSLGTLALAYALFASSAFANSQNGVIALYEVTDDAAFEVALGEFEMSLTEHGCVVAREGHVGGGQGDIGIEMPNRMLHLTCEGPILDMQEGRATFNHLNGSGTLLALIEGRYVGAVLQDQEAAAGRAYLLKLSRYSNSDPDARDRDLAVLGAQVSTVADAYRNEAVIEIHRAVGMPTPDEAVLLYYATPEAGDRFRTNNQDLLEQVGQFNRAHLTAFAYYFISPIR